MYEKCKTVETRGERRVKTLSTLAALHGLRRWLVHGLRMSRYAAYPLAQS
jgi:hypothetical protein